MELFAFNINIHAEDNQRIINPADWLGQRVVADDEQGVIVAVDGSLWVTIRLDSGAIVGKSTDQFKFLPSQPAS